MKTNVNKLIRDIANGDQTSFRVFYDLFSTKIYNIALSYVSNIEQAEEITQDVFVSIYKNAASFKGEAEVSTWLYRITINASLNVLKKNKRGKLISIEGVKIYLSDLNHPGVLLENKESARILFSAMEDLLDRQKTAFILSYIDGLPRQKVADIMEITLKAVESLLQRAKKNLRENLEKVYPERRKWK